MDVKLPPQVIGNKAAVADPKAFGVYQNNKEARKFFEIGIVKNDQGVLSA